MLSLACFFRDKVVPLAESSTSGSSDSASLRFPGQKSSKRTSYTTYDPTDKDDDFQDDDDADDDEDDDDEQEYYDDDDEYNNDDAGAADDGQSSDADDDDSEETEEETEPQKTAEVQKEENVTEGATTVSSVSPQLDRQPFASK